MPMTNTTRRHADLRGMFTALLLALAAACGSDGTPTTEVDARVDAIEDAAREDADTAADAEADQGAVEPDVLPDIGGDCPPSDGQYGAACEADEACESGLCVEGICSQPCGDVCAPLCDGQRMLCRGVEREGGVVFACMPEVDDLCRGCVSDEQCASGRCVELLDGSAACGRDCDADGDCPAGYACGDGAPEREGQCVPLTGSCSCSAETLGLERPCTSANAFGACAGVEVCGEAGWGACDAPAPEEEVCDGVDQNCDGLVDNGAEVGGPCDVENEWGACEGVQICRGAEGFECIGDVAQREVCDGVDNDCDGAIDEEDTDEDGAYSSVENCGGCGLSCEGRFAFASEIGCAPDEDAEGGFRCVVVECAEGYVRTGDTLCQPLLPTLCQPCEADEECAIGSPGARCLEITDVGDPSRVAQVCGRDCAPGGAFGETCPEGYTCIASDGGAQCAPVAGTCSCFDAPDGFSVPCGVTTTSELEPGGDEGTITCLGARSCEGDGFGSCALPEDVCNGFDDDCSGRIDDAYRDEAGAYRTDAHCGRCNNDCTLRFTAERENATGVCVEEGSGPTCAMVCLEGFFDVVNGVDDGCECELRSEDDAPDTDPSACEGSCDANCDGIDGVVARGIFVSKVGRDAADAGSIADPLRSIGAALDRGDDCLAGASDVFCPSGGVRDIYVATGVYSENVVLRAGLSLYGGYGLDFAQRDPVANPTTLFGVEPTSDEVGTITARGIDRDTRVSGFQVYGFTATTPGESSYAVWLADCTDALRVTDNVVIAANGAAGRPGARGASGASGDDGSVGGLGRASGSDACGVAPTPGGAGGASVCGASGGLGGQAQCPFAQAAGGGQCTLADPESCFNQCEEGPCTPPPIPQGLGATGANNGGCVGASCGTGGEGAYDFWSSVGGCSETCTFSNDGDCDDGGPGSDFDVCALGTDCIDCGFRVQCTSCGNQVGLRHIGGDGASGQRGADGSAGLGCARVEGSVDESGRWRPSAGDDGTNDATSGGGGGGGSAGAGFDVTDGGGCTDNLGGSGGGGGGGGCAGSAGTGGSGGGSSFAVFVYVSAPGAVLSLPVLEGNAIFRGAGGAGGTGGSGGAGGLGGFGGEGGFTFPNQSFCTSPGGRGGDGGLGGAGAGGGGGCGGSAIGIQVILSGADFADVGAALRDANAIGADGRAGRGGLGGGATSSSSVGGDGRDGALIDVDVR